MIYALLMLLSFAGPFMLSFDKKVSYKNKFQSVFFSSCCIAIPFILWDFYFTQKEIWGFNENYLIGIHLYNLPLEEISFFIIIPFCCIFIHEVLKSYFNPNLSQKYISFVTILITVFCISLLFFFADRTYTLWSASLSLLLIIIGYFYFQKLLGSFYVTYFTCLIPFFIVNGILTGYITDDPIVWYNNFENCSIRVATIPVEDFIYNFSLLFSNLLCFNLIEKLKTKKKGE